MGDVVTAGLPVVTLVLGAGLANLLKFSELRRSLRLDAADQLAEMPALMWDKTTPSAWLDLSAAVSRLSIRLSLAGIHPDLVERVRVSALAFWESLYVIGQGDSGDIWSVREDPDDDWTLVSSVVSELLGTNSKFRSWWVARRAHRMLDRWDADEQTMLDSLTGQGG